MNHKNKTIVDSGLTITIEQIKIKKGKKSKKIWVLVSDWGLSENHNHFLVISKDSEGKACYTAALCEGPEEIQRFFPNRCPQSTLLNIVKIENQEAIIVE